MNDEDIKLLQGVLGVEQDGDIGPITRLAIANKLISIFKKEIGTFETSKNHGEGIEKYWTATSYEDGYKNREPYCSAALCWVFKVSKLLSDKLSPKTPTAFGWEEWGKRIGITVAKPPKSIKKGDVVVFSFSHVALATSDSDSSGNFNTIEANTGSNGERDGDGVYAKTRNIKLVRSVVRF